MDIPSERPPDPLAAWLSATQGAAAGPPAPEEPADPERRRPFQRRLVVAAVIPWIFVLGLGFAAAGRPTSTVPPAPPAPAPAVGTASPAATPPAASETPLAGTLDPRLAAAAVLTVRMAAPQDQYIDTAVAERSDPVQGATVVTVAAAVLDRVDGTWTGPRHVRFAVALSVGQSEPVALSAPWVLPDAQRSVAQPPATPVDDPSLAAAATAALEAGGYRAVAAPEVRRHPKLPDILAVHVRARAPGEPTARDHEIWLDAAASRVLGVAATPAPAHLPAPVPAEAS